MEDLGHVRTEHCLSDCFTKQGVKPDAFIRAVETGILPEVDTNPTFRSQLQHRAYWTACSCGRFGGQVQFAQSFVLPACVACTLENASYHNMLVQHESTCHYSQRPCQQITHLPIMHFIAMRFFCAIQNMLLNV